MKKFLQSIIDVLWNDNVRCAYKMAIKRGETASEINRIKSKLIKL